MPTLSLLAFLLLTMPALAERIVGRASVIDGNTLDVRDTRIRLHGIDAPGSGQTCKDAVDKDSALEKTVTPHADQGSLLAMKATIDRIIGKARNLGDVISAANAQAAAV